MKKISTLFKKNPINLGLVINEINPDNSWALQAVATRKFDGTACAIIQGELFKRYDAKLKPDGTYKKSVPAHAIPCQEPDLISGHHPHWVKCDPDDKADQYHFEAFYALSDKKDGTYELCGEKIQGNPEKIKGHRLILHGSEILNLPDRTYEGIKAFLTETDIEGIVFQAGNALCKIRKTDFGIKRGG